MTIRPADVIAQYLDASSLNERRTAQKLFNSTNALDVCRIARELGYTGLNVGINSVWREYWHLSNTNRRTQNEKVDL